MSGPTMPRKEVRMSSVTSPRRRLGNQIRTVALLGALAAAVAGAGSLLGPGFALIGLAVALAINLGAYFFSDRLVLRMSGARPLPRDEAPALHAMLDELAARAAIPAPRLYLTPEAQPNAFATGRDPRHGVVAVAAGLLATLSPRELRGVLAHELAHIKNRDVLVATIAGAMASALTWLAHALAFSSLFGGGDDDEQGSGAGGLLFMLFAPIGATLIQLGVSRSREYLADAEAARLTDDPEGLALALERLEAAAPHAAAIQAPEPATASLRIANPLAGGGGLAGWFSTHPPIAERARRLRAMAPAAAPAPRRGRAVLRWHEGVS